MAVVAIKRKQKLRTFFLPFHHMPFVCVKPRFRFRKLSDAMQVYLNTFLCPSKALENCFDMRKLKDFCSRRRQAGSATSPTPCVRNNGETGSSAFPVAFPIPQRQIVDSRVTRVRCGVVLLTFTLQRIQLDVCCFLVYSLKRRKRCVCSSSVIVGDDDTEIKRKVVWTLLVGCARSFDLDTLTGWCFVLVFWFSGCFKLQQKRCFLKKSKFPTRKSAIFRIFSSQFQRKAGLLYLFSMYLRMFSFSTLCVFAKSYVYSLPTVRNNERLYLFVDFFKCPKRSHTVLLIIRCSDSNSETFKRDKSLPKLLVRLREKFRSGIVGIL